MNMGGQGGGGGKQACMQVIAELVFPHHMPAAMRDMMCSIITLKTVPGALSCHAVRSCG